MPYLGSSQSSGLSYGSFQEAYHESSFQGYVSYALELSERSKSQVLPPNLSLLPVPLISRVSPPIPLESQVSLKSRDPPFTSQLSLVSLKSHGSQRSHGSQLSFLKSLESLVSRGSLISHGSHTSFLVSQGSLHTSQGSL